MMRTTETKTGQEETMTMTFISPERIHAFRRSCMGRNAADMFNIAVFMAGYDADELWNNMKAHARRPVRFTETQVTKAMGRIFNRYKDEIAGGEA